MPRNSDPSPRGFQTVGHTIQASILIFFLHIPSGRRKTGRFKKLDDLRVDISDVALVGQMPARPESDPSILESLTDLFVESKKNAIQTCL